MGKHNSQADIYLALIKSVYADVATRHGFTLRESRRDILEIERRYHSEGIGFLTKTLPRLGKAIDLALSTDAKLQVSGFKLKTGTSLPRFLWELISKAFDATGVVREDASAVVVKDMRQVCLLLYKLAIPHTAAQADEVWRSFVEVDAGLIGSQETAYSSSTVIHRLKKARIFISRVLSKFDHRDIIPRHGPGAVATGEKVHEKSNFSRIYQQIERVYPFTDYFMFSLSHVNDQFDWLQSREVLETGTAKVVLVPKDSRGPRLISCEPLEFQWIQQGLRRKMYSILENHPLTSGHLNFEDQSVNRNLARAASLDASMVTMDMKDASDRVSLWLVESLFGGSACLEGLLAARSAATVFPNGSRVVFNKYAPMGSALCFPVMGLSIFALLVSCISSRRNESMRISADRVYVYGDDIIIPSEDYASCAQFLEEVGLKVNLSKCCTGRFFRESCGMDAFKGDDVTPIKVKTLWSNPKRSPEELASWTEYSNSLWERGYYTASDTIRSFLIGKYGRLPWKHSIRDGYIGFYRSHVDAFKLNIAAGFCYRRNKDLQRLEIRTRVSSSVLIKAKPDPWRELLRRFNAEDHRSRFGTYALTHRSRLKRVWILLSY